jgi:tRNA(Leu) C34 or U34 (ribose-2'-O)-methylase TrmL
MNIDYINDGQHHYIAVNKDEEKTFFFAGISKKDVKKKLINWITENKISIPMWKIKF